MTQDPDDWPELIEELFADELATVRARLPADVLAILSDRLELIDLASMAAIEPGALANLVEAITADKLATLVHELPPGVLPILAADHTPDELFDLVDPFSCDELAEVLMDIVHDEREDQETDELAEGIASLLWVRGI